MLAPTSRLLELLELLQTQPLTTGREIADRLEIDRRTVRRYVAALQELGIPVEGERGVGGGYRLRPGYRLPPLMLDDDEATVVVLGLVMARRLGLDGGAASVEGALAKIHRVLPDTLRRRVEALEATLGFTTPETRAHRWRATRSSGSQRRSGGGCACAPATARSRVRLTQREPAPSGSSCTRGAGTCAAHDHGRETSARSGSIACDASP